MPKREIRYEHVDAPDTMNEAEQDLLDWLNVKQKEMIEFLMDDPTLTPERFAFYMSIAGVTGYPVWSYYYRNHCTMQDYTKTYLEWCEEIDV